MFDISRQNSSYHNLKPKSDKYKKIKELIIRIFYYSLETYGHRRIHKELRRLQFKIGRNKVLQLMNELDLHPYYKRKTTHPAPGKENYCFPNKVERNFKADAPYELLLSDVTEIKYKNTKIYLSVVMDVFNSEILAYDLRTSANKEQALSTFKGLINVLPNDSRPLLHTDQGWQYINPDIVNLLKSANIEQSMSRAGTCLDNAMMESWFGRFKTEMIYKKHFESLDDLADKIHKYITFYNEERLHSRLCYLSPKEYKEIYFANLNKA